VRRFRLWILAAVLVAAGTFVVINSVAAAPPAKSKSIVGKWNGLLIPVDGTPSQHFTMVVYRGERAGTWRLNATCHGKLRLKDISDGYHHYYRMAGANPGCVVLGIDCFERDGARMADAFVPYKSTGAANANAKFRRVG
jgi:hypothetical protein